MPTGSALAAFNLKQLVGFQDIGLRGIAAIRASHVEATQARWDVDGVFNTKLTLNANGANVVQVSGTSKATDGLGHVLQISAAYKNQAQFQNTNAIVYHVGFMYAEIPSGLRINPRTGKPQFDRYVEEVGFAAAPSSVTDNGNGTITFNVNSVTEAGVTNAGRLVRVYKVVPADGALTFAMALEECTVTFGANNTITTVGKFGQTTVSTTAGDYIVVCMGPRVARNTDLSLVSGVVYVGTVTGNGGTPGTFSNANQTLLKTFVDATQVAYTPAGWLAPGATNVQLALDALVNGLQASTPSGALSGANRVGVYAPDWTSVANGGIGNVADANFTTSSTVKDLGLALDRAVARRWSWFVKNDGTFSNADDATGTSITNTMAGRPMWVRTLNNAATTPYTWGSDTSGTALSNYMVGEFADITQANPHLRFTRLNQASGARAVSGNKWERLWLDAAPSASYRFGGTAQRSGLMAQLCGFNGGALLIDCCAATSNQDWGFNFRNGIVVPKDETTKAYGASVRFGLSTGAFLWSVWENMLVIGPSPTQTSPAGGCFSLYIDNTVTGALNAATVAAQSRPFVFRDTVFINQRATDTTVFQSISNHPAVFENCRFFGFVGHAAGAAVLAGAQANITMRDCIIFDPEGQCIDFGPSNGISGLIENCTFVAGFGSTATIANPSPAVFCGDAFGLTILNSRIIIHNAVNRTNAGAPTNPMVKAIGTSIGGLMVVKGLLIKIEGTAGNFGNNYIFSSEPSNGQHNRIILEDVAIDCGANQPVSTATNPLVVIAAGSNATIDTRVSRISLNNIGVPVTTDFTQPLMQLSGIVADGVTIGIPIAGAGTARYDSALKIGGGSKVRNVNIVNAPSARVITAPISITGDGNTLEGIVRPLNPFISSGTPTAQLIYCIGNFNKIGSFQLSASNAASGAIVIDGRDNELHDVFLDTTTGASNQPAVQFLGATNRRNRCLDSTFHYNGTTFGAVTLTGPDCLLDSCCAYRSAGAVAAFANAGAGSVTGSTITSTTL